MVDEKNKRPELTRARAEKMISACTTVEELENEKFTKHANKHVREKAKHKLRRLT
jgi:hypothetical protein